MDASSSAIKMLKESWTRPKTAKADQPTDERIEKIIRQVPFSSGHMDYWPIWRRFLLQQRDFSCGLIKRHASLEDVADQELYQPLRPPNMNWIVNPRNEVKGLRPSNPYSGSSPATFDTLYSYDPVPAPRVDLLGAYITRTSDMQPWDDSLTLLGNASGFRGWQEWTRQILLHQAEPLYSAGIFSAVLLSQYEYKESTAILQAFGENWNSDTNTFFAGATELTITLWDIRQMAGLPIVGEMYDEYVPKEEFLFGRDAQDKVLVDEQVQGLFYEYGDLLKKYGEVTFTLWMKHFVNIHTCSYTPSPVSNPFPRKGDKEPVFRSSTSLDSDGSLVAYLAMWLCYFVLPRGDERADIIRPEVFMMAAKMAKGKRVSLAPAVLANIFNAMRRLSKGKRKDSDEKTTVIAPFHFIYSWLGMHYPAIHTNHRNAKDEKLLPLMFGFANCSIIQPSITEARKFVRDTEHSDYPLSIRPNRHRSEEKAIEFEDTPALMMMAREFLWSIRPSRLPFRSGGTLIVEPYYPGRAARQFGFDQGNCTFDNSALDVPLSLAYVKSCWRALSRKGTGERFYFPDMKRDGMIVGSMSKWCERITRIYLHRPLNQIPFGGKPKTSSKFPAPVAVKREREDSVGDKKDERPADKSRGKEKVTTQSPVFIDLDKPVWESSINKRSRQKRRRLTMNDSADSSSDSLRLATVSSKGKGITGDREPEVASFLGSARVEPDLAIPMINTAFLLIRNNLEGIVRDPHRVPIATFRNVVNQVSLFMEGAGLPMTTWNRMSEQFMSLLTSRSAKTEKLMDNMQEYEHAIDVNQLKFNITAIDDRGHGASTVAEDAKVLDRARAKRDDLGKILLEAQHNFDDQDAIVKEMEHHHAKSEASCLKDAKKLESLRKELATKESEFEAARTASKVAKAEISMIDDKLYALLNRFGDRLPVRGETAVVESNAIEVVDAGAPKITDATTVDKAAERTEEPAAEAAVETLVGCEDAVEENPILQAEDQMTIDDTA